MSKNADGWIRHRGGKCPVEDGTLIEYRERNGNIEVECEPELLGTMWFHENHPHDIMAYKLHKPAEQVEPFIEAVQAFNAMAKVPQLDGPIGWRDRITEIDATAQALTAERAELVQKLASEGFALIGRINELLTDAAQKHEDMGDPNNWKHGDVLYCTSSDTTGKQFIEGSLYVFESYTDGCSVRVEQDSTGKPNGMMPYALRWHSRPSA